MFWNQENVNNYILVQIIVSLFLKSPPGCIYILQEYPDTEQKDIYWFISFEKSQG